MYYVIEGPDGAGKTTLIEGISRGLDSLKVKHIRTRHPGGTAAGEEIRKLVKNKTDVSMQRYTEQVLIAADYCEFIEAVLKPVLADGQVCISDRSNLVSGMVYGLAGGVEREQIEAFQNISLALGFPRFRLFVLTASMEGLLERRHVDKVETKEGVKEAKCRFESRGDEFHKKVCDYYRLLTDPDISWESCFFHKRLPLFVQERPGHPLSIHKLDALKSPDDILNRALSVIRADLLA